MRTALATLAVLAAVAATPVVAAETGRMVFDVYRDDTKIGTHRIDFRRTGTDRIEVEIAIDLEVGIGPITLYRYRHRNATLWVDGRLQRMDARTDDDGETYTVTARAGGDGLRVESSTVPSYVVPADALPTTYWMQETVSQSRLINTQNGKRAEVAVAGQGADELEMPASRVSSRRFEMSGDIELTLWYEPGKSLAKLAFEARGKPVAYKLVERAGFVPASLGRPGTHLGS
jgi:hypothetical protein